MATTTMTMAKALNEGAASCDGKGQESPHHG